MSSETSKQMRYGAAQGKWHIRARKFNKRERMQFWLPPTLLAASALTLHAAETTQPSLHYFRVDGGADLILSTAKAICGDLIGGSYERKLEVKCDTGSCSANYTSEADYFDKCVYLTPTFDVLFQADDSPPRPEDHDKIIPFEWGTGSKISVRVSTTLSASTKESAAAQSGCFQAVGKNLLDKFKPYEVGSVIASLPTSYTADYMRVVYDLDGIDYAVFYVSYPKRIIRGTPFTLEAIVIPSQSMGIQKLVPTTEDEIQFAQKQLLVARDKIGSNPPIISRRFRRRLRDLGLTGTASSKTSEFGKFPLVGYENSFGSASIKVAGGDFLVASLAPEKQALKPLRATSWSWVVTGNSAGDGVVYLSLSASGKDGAEMARVIPIKVIIARDWLSQLGDFINAHIEWIIGSALVPLTVLGWREWLRRRHPGRPSHRRRQ